MFSAPPSSPFPDEGRRPPGRLIAVAIVGVILFSLLYMQDPTRFAPTPTPPLTPPRSASPEITLTPVSPDMAPPPASLSALATSRAETARSSGPEATLACARPLESDATVYGERAIAYGVTVTSQLDECGQAWFTFTGASGDRVLIVLGIPGGATSLAVHDVAQRRLIAAPEDAQLELVEIRDYALPADGRYFVLASDRLGRPLAYTLALHRLP
jgi:hypothetical protein